MNFKEQIIKELRITEFLNKAKEEEKKVKRRTLKFKAKDYERNKNLSKN